MITQNIRPSSMLYTSDEVEHNGDNFCIEFDFDTSRNEGAVVIIGDNISDCHFLVADYKIDWAVCYRYSYEDDAGMATVCTDDCRSDIPQAIIDNAEVILRKIRMRAFR